MNPLDLRGPDFLAFYIPYVAVVFALALVARWLWKNALAVEAGQPLWTPGVYPREGDAYAIALLRGGPKEVANTVLGRLFSAGLIEVSDRDLRRTEAPGGGLTLNPIESVALHLFDQAVVAAKADKEVLEAIGPHLRMVSEDLERQGLIPNPAQRSGYRNICGLALLAVSGLGTAKLLVALARGKSNVEFLMILLAVFTFLGYYLLKPPLRTRSGDKYFNWLKESHRGLMNLLSSGRRDDLREMALIAGIYGLKTLPVFSPLHTALNPPSSGGDGGSGCGGGGCGGGGCGGCGG
ncbi:MAG TPA: TIGR04222 domain-containing membrane protein [Thermoanaerobaculia bacterium]|jgi:uncharacterized protein (TIGR04222 family)|nr:TIGR04222 domain-containing membrane protein [Thermoanaerobaculia bacterium]